uniref:Uncharacterized protein n=1 Tax=Arundo donax TaxID=35708 RepID=A0A0A8Z4X7_ARUDO
MTIRHHMVDTDIYVQVALILNHPKFGIVMCL